MARWALVLLLFGNAPRTISVDWDRLRKERLANDEIHAP